MLHRGSGWRPPSCAAARSRSMTASLSETATRAPAAAKPSILVRSPTLADIPGVAALFSEMQRHYSCPVSDKEAVDAATLACKSVTSGFDPRVLIAEVAYEIVGSVVLNVTFPASALSRSLYIRDLYVAGSMRRRGVGQALFKAAAQLTHESGFSALDWTTDTANTSARRMYEACGGRVQPRTFYRLAREDMALGS